jgi:acyl-CoA reductase-like NAD-dependent aldehyde dehydrogenase
MGSYTPTSEVAKIVEDVQAAFKTDKTRPIEWRKEQLKQMWHMLDDHEVDLQEALFLDEGKPTLEAQLFEMALVKNEILHFLKDMDSWLEPETVSVPEPFQYWQPTVHKQPKGTILIIAPWNYPICLTMLPLVAAIAAGNTAIVKPR